MRHWHKMCVFCRGFAQHVAAMPVSMLLSFHTAVPVESRVTAPTHYIRYLWLPDLLGRNGSIRVLAGHPVRYPAWGQSSDSPIPHYPCPYILRPRSMHSQPSSGGSHLSWVTWRPVRAPTLPHQNKVVAPPSTVQSMLICTTSATAHAELAEYRATVGDGGPIFSQCCWSNIESMPCSSNKLSDPDRWTLISLRTPSSNLDDWTKDLLL